MPTYAVLGATGRVGQSILKVLLQSPDNTIHAFCRSKQKLLKLLPDLATNPTVQIFEGSITDTKTLASCLTDTKAAFLATAPNGNQPNTTVAEDTCRLVVSALQTLSSTSKRPKLILLSSASTDHSLMESTPAFLLNLLYCANYHIYEDLKRAEAFLLSQSDFVTSVIVKPSALAVDEQKGHSLSLTQADTPLGYLDLAAGMVELGGMEGKEYDGKGVAVNATAKNVAFPWEAPGALTKGLLIYVFPGLYGWMY